MGARHSIRLAKEGFRSETGWMSHEKPVAVLGVPRSAWAAIMRPTFRNAVPSIEITGWEG